MTGLFRALSQQKTTICTVYCGGYDWLLCEEIRPLEYHAVKPITSGLKRNFEPIIMGFAHTRAPASKETGAVKSESDQGS